MFHLSGWKVHLCYDSEGITRIGRNLHKPGNHPGDVMQNFIAFSDFITYAVTVRSIYNLTILPACRRAKYASLSSGVLLQSPMANKFSISSTLRNWSTLRLPFFSILSESFDWYAMELTFSPVQRNTRSVSMLVPLSVVSVKGPEIQGLSESNCQKHVSY